MGDAYDQQILKMCTHQFIDESRLANECEHGCKYYRCRRCNEEIVVHYIGYGCRKEERC
jgi:hypothetical protein